jgi:pimeloyl-ACP methyl ester carboxylesterase
MRSYPEGIWSVVLDSVVPPQFNMFVDPNLAEAKAFKAFFAGCRRARTCSRDYPHLERTFDQLLTRLDRRPIKLLVHGGSTSHNVPINGDEIAQFLRGTMYSSEGLSLLPQDIKQFDVGQRGALLDLYDWLTQGSGVADGMYRSVVCAEDAPYATAAALTASVVDLPKATRPGALTYQRDELGICRIWKVRPADSALRQPVSSTIPTLLLGGEYDPITLPSNVKQVVPALSHSYAFIFPGSGHGIRYSDECPDQIIDDFYDDPLHRPDSSCISVMKEPF